MGRFRTLIGRFLGFTFLECIPSRISAGKQLIRKGEAFLLTAGVFLLTVKFLRLQSLKALFRRTLPL